MYTSNHNPDSKSLPPGVPQHPDDKISGLLESLLRITKEYALSANYRHLPRTFLGGRAQSYAEEQELIGFCVRFPAHILHAVFAIQFPRGHQGFLLRNSTF